MKKYVYSFKEGRQKMRDLLGGKGANLCEMLNLGLPVPLGFIVSTEACNLYYENNQEFSKTIQKEIFEQLVLLEKRTKKSLGNLDKPLLLSVRSGARVSMPGMMDTILNLGLNDQIVENISLDEGLAWFAHDSYRRFISMYADVVAGLTKEFFDDELNNYKKYKKIEKDQDLTVDHLKEIIDLYKKNYKKLAKESFPQDPNHQLMEAIKAIFRSWSNQRAISYRKMNNIPDDWGTAVTVQEMVYGNIGNNSGSGVAFSRNPATGENEFYGEFLINAQGEDVVAGIRTPLQINELKKIMPNIYVELYGYIKQIERHYRDMQDVEFTIENEKLYMLQTRTGKRTMQSAIKIALDLVSESLISKEEALLKLNPNQFDQLLHSVFVKEELNKATKLTKGFATSPGVATGRIYFSKEALLEAKNSGSELILVRNETSPEDIEGMANAKGILTVFGGMTSHAAVVARGMGISCVSGCENLKLENKKAYIGETIIKEGEYLSIDGNTGNVYLGRIATEKSTLNDELFKILTWANVYQKIEVLANADTQEDAKLALSFFAKGIGLCRTEHMFFKEERLLEFRKLILGWDPVQKDDALAKIEKFQEQDFYEIFKQMDGLPVTIRYLDPPLHEFMPKKEEEIEKLAKDLKLDVKQIKNQIDLLNESNPMMGHRGVRLAVTYPNLLRAQTRAVINAAIKALKNNIKTIPELMLPLITTKEELKYLTKIIKEEADNLIKENQVDLKYQIGAMIEVPRAALIASEIATEVDFISFGTNDLTQMTFGFSRDDANKYIEEYYQKGLLLFDPFVKLDSLGVGQLIKMAVLASRKANKNIKIGICGEHGGNPESINFFYDLGLDYVSCSSYRIPTAILTSAQLTIKNNELDLEKMIIKG